MLAATGVLRGLQDTRTPLVVAVGGNVAQHRAQPAARLRRRAGSTGSASPARPSARCSPRSAQRRRAARAVVVRAARREGALAAPRPARASGAAAHAGVALVVRTLTLRAALLVTTYAVVLGAPAPARPAGRPRHPPARAAPSGPSWPSPSTRSRSPRRRITGRYLGAGDVAGTRAVTRRMVSWGVVSGVVTGVALAALSPWLGRLFTNDPAVRDLLVPVLLVAALGQPVAGVVFVLDGVLIGAGDGAYLAWAGLVVLAVYVPVVLAVAALAGSAIVAPRGLERPDLDLGRLRGGVRWAPERRSSCAASAATPGWSPAPADLRASRSGRDDVEGHRGGHLVVQLDGHLVGAERLDRVVTTIVRLSTCSPETLGERGGDLGDGDGAEEAAALAGADLARDRRGLELGLDLRRRGRGRGPHARCGRS